jgi:hypothetical protein
MSFNDFSGFCFAAQIQVKLLTWQNPWQFSIAQVLKKHFKLNAAELSFFKNEENLLSRCSGNHGYHDVQQLLQR